MTELQKKLDMAYMQLQQIAVSGGGVKHLALAMQMLEDAFKLAAGDGETEDKRGRLRAGWGSGGNGRIWNPPLRIEPEILWSGASWAPPPTEGFRHSVRAAEVNPRPTDRDDTQCKRGVEGAAPYIRGRALCERR